MKDLSVRLSEIATLWNKVEKRAKAAEQFRGEAIIAAINEMRYAGRRIVDAWALINKEDGGADSREEIDEHLIIAKSYLTNADHDLTDACCFIVLRRVAAAIEQHGLLRITTFVPEFKETYPLIVEAQQIIQGSREDRKKRLADYDRLADEYLDKFQKLYKQIVDCRELAVRETVTAQIRALWEKLDLLQVIVVIGAVAGVLAAALTLIDILFLRSNSPL